jgi:hypothetical protein
VHIAGNVFAYGPAFELGEYLENADPLGDLSNFFRRQLLMVSELQHIRGVKKQDLTRLRVKGVCHLGIVNRWADVHDVESLIN